MKGLSAPLWNIDHCRRRFPAARAGLCPLPPGVGWWWVRCMRGGLVLPPPAPPWLGSPSVCTEKGDLSLPHAHSSLRGDPAQRCPCASRQLIPELTGLSVSLHPAQSISLHPARSRGRAPLCPAWSRTGPGRDGVLFCIPAKGGVSDGSCRALPFAARSGLCCFVQGCSLFE